MEPRIVSQRTAFSTPWFDVIEKGLVRGEEDGAVEPYFVVQPPDYVTPLAITDNGMVLLVRQYRPTVEGYALELPSGHVDPGETPEEAAVRELYEETGYRGDRIELLGEMTPDSGRLGNRLWGYVALDVTLDVSGEWKPEPDVEVVLCAKEDVPELVRRGELCHAFDLAVLALAMMERKL
ncbi:MAG: NUDIX hydrolase [bacterium]|nr:NUDIX hydrolase [bacterium]